MKTLPEGYKKPDLYPRANPWSCPDSSAKLSLDIVFCLPGETCLGLVLKLV